MKENSLKAQLLVKSILKKNPPKEMTLLSLGQVRELSAAEMWLYHTSQRTIDVIKKVGRQCEITDYALIQNTDENTTIPPRYKEENNYSLRYGSYYLRTINDSQVWYVDENGKVDQCLFENTNIGIRPVLVCPELKQIKDVEILQYDVIDQIKHPNAKYPKDVQPLKINYG